MTARDIWGILKEQYAGVLDDNKLHYKVAQVLFGEMRKEIKDTVKQNTGKTPALLLEKPLSREERLTYIQLRLDSALVSGDEIAAQMLAQFKDILDLKIDNQGTVVETVAFREAFPDFEKAIAVCGSPMMVEGQE